MFYKFKDFKDRRLIIQISFNFPCNTRHSFSFSKSTVELIIFFKELGAKSNKTVPCLKWELAVSVGGALGKDNGLGGTSTAFL